MPQIPYKVGTPRVGDLACVYADPSKAAKELLWKAQFGLEVRTEDFRSFFSFFFKTFFSGFPCFLVSFFFFTFGSQKGLIFSSVRCNPSNPDFLHYSRSLASRERAARCRNARHVLTPPLPIPSSRRGCWPFMPCSRRRLIAVFCRNRR